MLIVTANKKSRRRTRLWNAPPVKTRQFFVKEVANLPASQLSKKWTQQPDVCYQRRRSAWQRQSLKAFTVTIKWITLDEYRTTFDTAQSLISGSTMECDNNWCVFMALACQHLAERNFQKTPLIFIFRVLVNISKFLSEALWKAEDSIFPSNLLALGSRQN